MSDLFPPRTLGPRVVHLVSGEDIIGDVTIETEPRRGYTIKSPITVALAPSPDGRGMRISIVPLRPYAKEVESMFVADEHVVYITELSEQMLKSYIAYTSDIVLPDTPTLSSLLT